MSAVLSRFEEPDHCTECNGSGEGMHDGTTCSYCKGKGVTFQRDEPYIGSKQEYYDDIRREFIESERDGDSDAEFARDRE